MKIESPGFGSIVIDGRRYNRDVIVLHGEVRPDWWRKEGHGLYPEDISEVLAARPEVFVLGCGWYGALKVSPETRRAFEEAGIRLVCRPTPEACQELTRLLAEGVDAAGGFHLTC